MEFISQFFVHVSAFFQDTWNWMYLGIYDFAVEFMVYATKAAMFTWFKIQLFAIDVAFEVVSDLFRDFGVTDKVQQAWMLVPEQMRSTLSFFGIPQALTIIVSAIPAKFAMKFIPFIGR